MLAVHMPACALRCIASFAELEFDVCLRDCRLPFSRRHPAAVYASRVSVAPQPRQLAPPTLVPPAGTTGELGQLVSFAVAPLSLPLALAHYVAPRGGLMERAPVLLDLTRFPPRPRPAVPAPAPWEDDRLLRRALTAVLEGSWAPWPAAPRTLVSAEGSLNGVALFFVELPDPAGAAPARLVRTLEARLDIPFATGPLPLAADPAGRFVSIALQHLGSVQCLQLCARTGAVLASTETQITEPGSLTALGPDLWLFLAGGTDTALLSATAPARPQPAFRRELAALWNDPEFGQPPSAPATPPPRRPSLQGFTTSLPWRMRGGRLVFYDVTHPAGPRVLLAELRGSSMHVCGVVAGSVDIRVLIDGGVLGAVCEGPEAECLVLRGFKGAAMVVREGERGALSVNVSRSLPVLLSRRAPHPGLAAVLRQAERQKEQRMAARLGAAPAAPLGSARNPLDLTQE
jgi:hypothetical protein